MDANEFEIAEAEAAHSSATEESEPTVRSYTSMVAPKPEQMARSSTLSNESAARQAANAAWDPASTTVVEITSESCEMYKVHEGLSARFRFKAVVSVTETVPETALVESSESTDILAERESPSVVLAVNVVVPSSSDTVVPVDAVTIEEVVEDAVADVELADTVLAASRVLRASVVIQLAPSLVDEMAAVVVAVEASGLDPDSRVLRSSVTIQMPLLLEDKLAVVEIAL